MRIWLATLPFLFIIGCSDHRDPQPAEPEPAPIERWGATGWTAMTLPELADALNNGDVTSEELVGAYLERIEQIDRNGPTLQSVLSINPDAMAAAQAADARRAAGGKTGPLHGIPILLKDNIETRDPLATTAGSLALQDNITGRDAPLAAGLRDAGTIILGKTNLSQWANFRSGNSMSGWSALGGQVRNPHVLDRNPCGSSSGSGAAIAASLAAGAVGTETNGSIICPANANGIVGFKPTVGLIDQQYIVPISSSQDTAGPMTKTVRGAAMMTSAMATGANSMKFESALDKDALNGARIGVMRFAQGSNPDIIALFDQALSDIEAAGATLVDIDEFQPEAEDFWGSAFGVLLYEFKATLNAYLQSTPGTVTTRSLSDLIAFNNANSEIELALFDQSTFEQAEEKGPLTSDEYLIMREDIQRATRSAGIDKLLAENDLDFLVSPSGVVPSRTDPLNGDVWPDWAGGGYLAAIAGYPHASVPMGSIHAMPVSLSFIGTANDDAKILSYAYAYEQATGHRKEPGYLSRAEARPEIAAAMKRRGLAD